MEWICGGFIVVALALITRGPSILKRSQIALPRWVFYVLLIALVLLALGMFISLVAGRGDS